MNKEEDTYNKDNDNTLKYTHIENNTEESIVEINVHDKDTDKEDSREDKEINVVENERYRQRKIVISKGLESFWKRT